MRQDRQPLSTSKGLSRRSGGDPLSLFSPDGVSPYICTIQLLCTTIASRICIQVCLVNKESKLPCHLPEYKKNLAKKNKIVACNLNNSNECPRNITSTIKVDRSLLTLLTMKTRKSMQRLYRRCVVSGQSLHRTQDVRHSSDITCDTLKGGTHEICRQLTLCVALLPYVSLT